MTADHEVRDATAHPGTGTGMESLLGLSDAATWISEVLSRADLKSSDLGELRCFGPFAFCEADPGADPPVSVR